MKKMFMFFTAAVFSVAMVASASADIVYTNDFSVDSGLITGAGSSLAVADANFSTQHLQLNSTATGGFTFPFYNGVDAVASPVATFSFDAYFGTTEFPALTSRLRLRTRPVSNLAANDITRVDLGQGGSAPAFGSVNHYDYIVNNTAAAAAIESLGGTIAANSYAIYQNGVSIDSGATFGTAAPPAAIDYLTLWIQGDNAAIPAQAKLDNFTVRNNAFAAAAIPEPGSLALLGLGALGLVARRRRQNS